MDPHPFGKRSRNDGAPTDKSNPLRGSELEPELDGGGARAKRRLCLAKVCGGDEVADTAVPWVALRAPLEIKRVEEVEETGANLELRILSQAWYVRCSEYLGQGCVHIEVVRARQGITDDG